MHLKELFAQSIDENGKHADVLLNPDERTPADETKAIDPTDESREWTDEELAAFTEEDVKFALGSSTEAMREILRTQPNENGNP